MLRETLCKGKAVEYRQKSTKQWSKCKDACIHAVKFAAPGRACSVQQANHLPHKK